MSARTLLVAGASLAAVSFVTPASANGFPGGGWNGNYSSKKCVTPDRNGCSVSPVTVKTCKAELKDDLCDLAAAIAETLKDLYRGKYKDLQGDIAAIVRELNEIAYDQAVLQSLKKKK